MEENELKFIDLIRSILKRPGMYQVNKVEDLYYIILGYSFSQTGNLITDALSKFRRYVNAEFESKDDIDWCRLIRFSSSSDSHSLKLFGQIFEDFVSREYS
jgi:hypothetical protein